MRGKPRTPETSLSETSPRTEEASEAGIGLESEKKIATIFCKFEYESELRSGI
jgi:hypothetical protein